jgi:hypothetical protein
LFLGDIFHEVGFGGRGGVDNVNASDKDEVVGSPDDAEDTADDNDDDGSGVVEGAPAVRTVTKHQIAIVDLCHS